MHTVEDYASNQCLHGDPYIHGQCDLFLAVVEPIPILTILLAQLLHLFYHGLDSLLSLLAAGHLPADLLLSESARLPERLAETLLRTQAVDASLVVFLEHLEGLTHQTLHLIVQILHFVVTLFSYLGDHFIDFLHLTSVPLNLIS